MRFASEPVIVSGGASGIGRATALAFANEGARVAILDVDAAGGERVARELPGGLFIQTDVTRSSVVQTAIAQVQERFGAVRVLVNNAGTLLQKRLDEMSEAEWDFLLDLNLKAAFLLSRAVIPGMLGAGGGAIINVASVHAVQTFAKHAAYAASKAGLVGMTRAMALDYARDGIRVVAILPGAIHTPLMDRRLSRLSSDQAEALRLIGETQPLSRVGAASEVAAAILFAASPDASLLTGSSLVIDGGISAQLPRFPEPRQ